jgi:subtilisin family serine protease
VPAREPVGAALALLRDPDVEDAFPDVVLSRVSRSFDDPSYGGQWYLQELGMETLYEVSLGSGDVRIAVIDSGIDIAHPDLANKLVAPYDAYADDDDPSPEPGDDCAEPDSAEICDSHGTAVSGIAAAEANNGDGIVGMCPACPLIPIRLLGPARGVMSADIASFEHALANDAAVINNSWGYGEHTPAPQMLAAAIDEVATQSRGGKGALVVFAAGNDNRALEPDEIEALPGVLCVSATDSYGYPTAYTNFGPVIDLAAPSATVTIAPGDTVITNFGGTSAAGPVATGLAAWALSQDPEMTASELGDLLIASAEPSTYAPGEEHNDYYGWGNLSAANIYASFYGPPDTGGDEDRGSCACGAREAPSPLVALLGLLFLRRSRR